MTPKQIVIGLGTGRCGTLSLARFLNIQEGAEITHERAGYHIGWNGSEEKIAKFLEEVSISDTFNLNLVGDVGFYYLSYVEFILNRYPKTKFICLQRDCLETVTSYMHKTSNVNPWQLHDGIDWRRHNWDHCYPKYDVPDKKSALTLYWYDYYRQVTLLQALYPNSIKIFPTEALNSSSGQYAILAFLGIKKKNSKLKVGIRTNTLRQKRISQAREKSIQWIRKIFKESFSIGR